MCSVQQAAPQSIPEIPRPPETQQDDIDFAGAALYHQGMGVGRHSLLWKIAAANIAPALLGVLARVKGQASPAAREDGMTAQSISWTTSRGPALNP